MGWLECTKPCLDPRSFHIHAFGFAGLAHMNREGIYDLHLGCPSR